MTYIGDPGASSQPFDIASIPKISRAQAAKESARTSIGLISLLKLTCDLQGQAPWRHWVRRVRRRPPLPLPLQPQKHSLHTSSSLPRSRTSLNTALCSTAAQNPRSSRKARQSTRFQLSSTSSRSILYSRYVCYSSRTYYELINAIV